MQQWGILQYPIWQPQRDLNTNIFPQRKLYMQVIMFYVVFPCQSHWRKKEKLNLGEFSGFFAGKIFHRAFIDILISHAWCCLSKNTEPYKKKSGGISLINWSHTNCCCYKYETFTDSMKVVKNILTESLEEFYF